MPAREITKTAQSAEAFALELWAQIEVLNATLTKLADGIATARAAGQMFQQMEKLMNQFEQELDRLAKSVEGITGVVPSVVATLGDLAGKFKANATDPSRVSELADKLDAAKVSLANAIVSSTEAAPTGDPAPAPTPAPEPAPEPGN
jgi:hypothetical protein